MKFMMKQHPRSTINAKESCKKSTLLPVHPGVPHVRDKCPAAGGNIPLAADRCRWDKVNTGCTGSNEIFLQRPLFYCMGSAAQADNSVRKNLGAHQKHIHFHKFIVAVNMVVRSRHLTSKGHSPLQLMNVGSSSDGQRFPLNPRIFFIAFQKRADKGGMADT